jgi:excisionase family DNA binding protein
MEPTANTRTGTAELLKQETYQPEALATLLGIDLDVIRHAVFSGALPATMVGHDIVSIRRAEVLRWLENRA